MEVTGKALLEYACHRFEEKKYEEALEAFVLVYGKGFEQDWILENIYRCYMDGNDMEFRKAYKKQQDKIACSYEECVLDFIPCGEGDYFIFDRKERVFCGRFVMQELQETRPASVFENMEFSAVALELSWNWMEALNILVEAKERNVYAVCHDLRRAASFCKIPELEPYMSHIRMFADREEFQDYFHKNTSVYMPLIVNGDDKSREALWNILREEHQFRLTPEGRNTENILLTIAIPTYARGNLLLKRLNNLQSMPYNAEMEVVISKNGTKLYQEEYKEASQISDARINYYDHDCDLKATKNWLYTAGMARGKYIMMVSDEDDVVLPALEHYLKLLSDYPEVSLFRAKTRDQYSFIAERSYGKKGLEAFELAAFQQNYLSGLIFRREDFLREDFLQLEKFSENEFYKSYPHEWWCAKLSQKGDYLAEPVVLIYEGDSEMNLDAGLPWYSTYEARIKQFGGMMEFIRWMQQEEHLDAGVALYYAILKIMNLFRLARRYYADNGEKFVDAVNQFVAMALEAADEFCLETVQKKKILETVYSACTQLFMLHSDLNTKATGQAVQIDDAQGGV